MRVLPLIALSLAWATADCLIAGESADGDAAKSEATKPQFTAEQFEFFQRDIRPILADKCMHSFGAGALGVSAMGNVDLFSADHRFQFSRGPLAVKPPHFRPTAKRVTRLAIALTNAHLQLQIIPARTITQPLIRISGHALG